MRVARFEATAQEHRLIARIVQRASTLFPGLFGGKEERLTLTMDLTATNANGCPMDFDKLLGAPESDFLHDLTGIARHINRRSGVLEDCFLPRCAKPEVTA